MVTKRNPAKTVKNLKKGWFVSVEGSESTCYINLITNQVSGSFGMKRFEQTSYWVVVASQASDGWGPFLYDIALEMVNVFDDVGLMSDRAVVSREAHKVWQQYLRVRRDVEATPLPDHIPLIPDDYIEDGDDSPLWYSYSKVTGTPILTELAKAGRLSSDSYDLAK